MKSKADVNKKWQKQLNPGKMARSGAGRVQMHV